MKLKILHLSDLHFTYKDMVGDNWPTEEFNRDLVTRSLLEYLKKLYRGKEKPHLVLVTGDIAHGGKQKEYRVAEVFFNGLLKTLALPKDRLHLVPGNHDVDRTKVTDAQIKTIYRFEDQDTVSDIIADPGLFPNLAKKFEHFNSFAEVVMGRRLYDEKNYRYTDTLRMDIEGREIAINLAGLNSCLFAGYDGDDKQKLALSLRQVQDAVNQQDEEARLSLALFHHPFESFHPCDGVAQEELLNHFDLLLCGHLHNPDKCILPDRIGRAPLFGAGACFETRKSRNSFNEIFIDLTNGKGKVRFYKYLENKNCWNPEIDIFPKEKNGDYPFTLHRLDKNPLAKKPEEEKPVEAQPKTPPERIQKETEIIFIHDYLRPEKFTGRGDEKKRLGEIIRTGVDPTTKKTVSLASVIAIGGMGKSCLLREVVEECGKAGKFTRLLWFSFYEARTETEEYFFRQILSYIKPKAPREGKTMDAAEVGRLREELCRALDLEPTLLILDGLEVIQHADGEKDFRFGNIREGFREVYKLLSHICNRHASVAFAGSRTSLKEFSGIADAQEILLHTFSPGEGAMFLKNLGLGGSREERKRCSDILQGHPLSLKAAGKLLMERGLGAKDIEEITGDPELFKKCSEGEKVASIVNGYRQDLTEEQEIFLKSLSLHPRSVGEEHFPVLVPGYKGTADEKQRVRENILLPLKNKDLVEELKDASGRTSWSAHPLMKFAYSQWFAKGEKARTHEDYAKAALSSPDCSGSAMNAKSLEELQPFLDAVDHYLEAGNYKAAWDIYSNKDVDRRLNQLGYARLLLDYGRAFEKALEGGGWDPGAYDLIFFYQYLGHACNTLSLGKEYILYRKKQYESSQKTGITNKIISNGSILAQTLANMGMVMEGEALLKEIGGEFPKSEKNDIFIGNSGFVKLFSGKYGEAVPLFQEAIEASIDSRNKILYGYYLAEAHIRSGNLEEGERILRKAGKEVQDLRIQELLPGIYWCFLLLSLKKGNAREARSWENKRQELKTQLGLPAEEDGFLLVAEGEFDSAIRIAEPYLSTETEEKINKDAEKQPASSSPSLGTAKATVRRPPAISTPPRPSWKKPAVTKKKTGSRKPASSSSFLNPNYKGLKRC